MSLITKYSCVSNFYQLTSFNGGGGLVGLSGDMNFGLAGDTGGGRGGLNFPALFCSISDGKLNLTLTEILFLS
jgi:hypothetical protein